MRSQIRRFILLLAVMTPLMSMNSCASYSQMAGDTSRDYGDHGVAESAVDGEPCGPAEPSSFAPDEEAYPASVGDPYSMIRVFYGTNRKRNPGETKTDRIYSAKLGDLEFGFCDVSIPETHIYGEVERPSLWKLEFKEDASKHVVLQAVNPVSRDEFGAGLARTVANSDSGEVLIFVHGFNVSFAEASYRTAQISKDLDFDGAPVMYSWPSNGSVVKYPADISNADASEAKFVDFIETVAAKSNAKQIHLVAHSMGNRLVTSGLRRLGEESAYRRVAKLNEVILAAPDVDATTFKELIAPKILNASERVTIYASSTDRALQASKLLHQGSRLGLGGDSLVSFPEFPRIQVVDATGIDFELLSLGHSAYGDELLSDIRHTLAGAGPDQRRLQPHTLQAAWQIPDPDGREAMSSIRQTAHVTHEEMEPIPAKVSFWQRLLFWR